MSTTLAFVGLLLTLIGAALLFFYGLPRKKVGNVILTGDSVMTLQPEKNERVLAESEWQPIATKFWKRAKLLNSTGFALVALGTLLQMLALGVSA